jgi:hypothetical protein
LSCRIDELIEERGLTTAALAREVGVGASTIRRFRTADDAEADGVLALVAWTGDSRSARRCSTISVPPAWNRAMSVPCRQRTWTRAPTKARTAEYDA